MPANWMTTASAILSLISKIGLALATAQIPNQLQTPNITHYWLWFTWAVTALAAVSGAVIGFLQKDAQSVPVITAVIQANGGVQMTARLAEHIPPAELNTLSKP